MHKAPVNTTLDASDRHAHTHPNAHTPKTFYVHVYIKLQI